MIPVVIDMSHDDDEYTDIAFNIVNKWNAYLQQKGHIHGILAHTEELVQLIAQELRGRYNAINKETDNGSDEKTSTSNT
jgi:hypothetical protein